MKRFLAAIRFLTIVPVPGSWGTDQRDLAGSVAFFPVVGLLLGVVAAAAAWGFSLTGTPVLSAAILVAMMLAFSGGLHMDGLSDTADGFLSSRPRERILEIMKDSRVGAMGVIAIVLVMLVKFAALASVRPGLLWAAAGLMPLLGRCVMVLHIAMLPYVRPTGLGAVFCGRRPWVSAAFALAVVIAVCVAMFGLPGLALVGAWLFAALLLAAWSYRKIGGATGDTFGAACEVCEVVGPLVLAFWPMDLWIVK